MKKEDIKKLFEDMNFSDCSWMYKCCLTDLKIIMKDGSKINMMYNGSDIQYIDFSDDNYIGFGELLISPYENIKDIEVR